MSHLSSFSVGGVVVDAGHRKRLKFEDDAAYLESINQMATGASVVVTVEEEKPHRSKTWEQVKYWWAVVIPLVADHCGMSDRQAHISLLGEKFGYVEGLGGKLVPVEPSMSDLSVEKMTELISWVLDWAPAELEIIVPPPDKNWRQNAERIRRERGGHAA